MPSKTTPLSSTNRITWQLGPILLLSLVPFLTSRAHATADDTIGWEMMHEAVCKNHGKPLSAAPDPKKVNAACLINHACRATLKANNDDGLLEGADVFFRLYVMDRKKTCALPRSPLPFEQAYPEHFKSEKPPQKK